MKWIGIAIALGLFGCSQSPSTPNSPAQGDGGSSSVVKPASGLCDGLTFEAQRRGTGDQPVGERFLAENGYDFLVIDADCRFWVQERPNAGVKEGTLIAEAASRLSARLRLTEWPTYVGAYTVPLCDGSASVISFGGQLITVSPVCHGADNAERVTPILEAVRSTIEELSKTGTAVGRARYQLIAEGTFDEGGLTSSAPAYQRAPKWPLSISAAEVATPYVVANTTPEAVVAHTVEGDDATKLWDIVSAYTRGEIGVPGYFVPVLDDTGHGYRLFARGSVPFEDASGTWRVR